MKTNRLTLTIATLIIFFALAGIIMFIPQNAYAEGGGRGALTLKRIPFSDGAGFGSLGRQAMLATPTLPPRDELPTRETPEPDTTSPEVSDKGDSSISGQVWDLATGGPAVNATIIINERKYTTDSKGHYVVGDLPAGQYKVAIEIPTGGVSDYGEATVTIGKGEIFPLDLSFYSKATASAEQAAAPVSNTAITTVQASTTTASPANSVAVRPSSSAATTSSTIANNSRSSSSLTVYTGRDAAIWINPVFINHDLGEPGNVKVDVTNMSDFGGFQGQLNFDPKVVQIEAVKLGTFMESSGRSATPLLIDIDNKTGEAVFGAYSSGKESGPNGGGTLLLVSFTTTAEGRTKFELDNVILTSRLGNKIEAEMVGGTLNSSACFGDFNDDNIIDINDIQAVAGRIGQSQGQFNYDEAFDLNFDNKINDDDLVILTGRWNQTCSE